MKKRLANVCIVYVFCIQLVFALSLIAAPARAEDTQAQKILRNIIEKLDLTSFPNSVRLYRQDNKVTFKDYDITEVTFDGEKAIIRDTDNSSRFAITLLNKNGSKICFEDKTRYAELPHIRIAYVLRSNKSGFLTASKTKDPACPSIKSVNDGIAKATGLSIKRIDAQGRALPMTDDKEGSKIVISYKNKILMDLAEDEGDPYFKSMYLLDNEQVVLLSLSVGRLGCRVAYHLISIYDGTAHFSEGFSTCNVPNVIKTAENELFFTSDDGEHYARYKNHRLTEKLGDEEIQIPLLTLDPDNADGFRYLKKYADRDDAESILLDSKLNPMLLNLFGAIDFKGLQQEIWNGRGVEGRFGKLHARTTDGFIILSGEAVLNGASYAAFLMIGLDGHQLYAAALGTDGLRAYSNQPAGHTIPAEMQKWIADTQFSNIRWRYVN